MTFAPTAAGVSKPQAHGAITEFVTQLLLCCGILSSVLYVAANVVGALIWTGFSSISQTVSELSAIGAPSRPYVVPIFLVQAATVIAFGIGVWRAAGARRARRALASALIGFGIICLTAPFTPMHQRGMELTLTDTLHVLSAAVDVSFILCIIGISAFQFGRAFLTSSLITIVMVLVFGALTGFEGPRIAANLPTPWAGLTERISIGAYLVWVVVLATVLLRIQIKSTRANS